MAKKSRKELLKQDDAFITTAEQGFSWLRAHRVQVAVAGIGATLLVVVMSLGHLYLEGSRLSASAALKEALEVFNAEVVAEGGEEEDPSSDAPRFATEEEKLAAAKEKFEAVVDAAGEGGIGVFARFYLAHIAEKKGDKEEALRAYQELSQDLGLRDPIYFLAIERTAYLQEAAGKHDAAIATLDRLASRKDEFFADRATFHQARLHVERGGHEEAKKLLDGFEETFPESSALPDVKEFVRVLDASVGSNLGAPQTPDDPAEETDK